MRKRKKTATLVGFYQQLVICASCPDSLGVELSISIILFQDSAYFHILFHNRHFSVDG